MIQRWTTIAAAALISFLLLGCSPDDGLNRVEVFGTVTLDGVPAEVGQIRFVPQEGTPGPVTIQPIEQGEYCCDHHGGVPAGKHRVEILIWDPKVPPPRGPGERPRPQWAPKKYNQESELAITIENSGSAVKHDFAL
jgi:hypothetical protein